MGESNFLKSSLHSLRLVSTLPYRPFFSVMQRRLLKAGVPIFVFHYAEASPRACSRPADYCPPGEIEKHLSTLSECGYRTVSLDEVAAPDSGSKGVAAVTFDDGYASVVTNALPLLDRHKMSATMFVVSGALEKKFDLRARGLLAPLADPGLIREWLSAGHEIGSHSVTHRNLTKLSLAEAEEEMRLSKNSLEQAFGRPVRHFAYPYGRWNAELEAVARSTGYGTAATMKFGVNSRPLSLFSLKRIPVTGSLRLMLHMFRLGEQSLFARH